MNRIATMPLQQSIGDAMRRAQARLAETQAQLATGRRANDFASLGPQGARLLSAHALVAREDAYRAAAAQVTTTLAIQDNSINVIDGAASELRQSLITAVGTGQTHGLQQSIESAFQLFRSNLNAAERGVPVYGGGRLDSAPFAADNLSDLVGTVASYVFVNGPTRASATVGDQLEIQHGLLADELGSGLYEAFRTLAAVAPIGATPTAAQAAAMEAAVGELDLGLEQLRGANATNGRRQAQLDTLIERSSQRSNTLREIISAQEDADLSDIAIELAQQKTALEASYSVYAQLSGLSLLNYLR